MNYKYLLLLIILNASTFFGQNLDQVLRSKKEIKEKISAIELISEKYDRSDLDSATFYKLVIDSLAALTNDYDLKSQAKRNLALIYVAQPDKAMKIAYQNLDLSTQSKDCKLITRAYILLARVNWFIRNDTKVFAFWNQALKEAEKCKDKEILMLVYSQGENHFFNTQQFEKSKQLSLKMAQLNPELLKESGYYAGIGDVFRAMEKLDSADIYYKKAIKLEEDKKNFIQLVSLYSNYSLIPRAQKKYDVSIAYCKKALDLAVKFESEEWINIVYRQLSDTYYDKGDYKNAKIYQEKTVRYAEITKRTLDQIWTNDRLANINAQLNNFKDAYYSLDIAFRLYEDYNSSESKSNLNKVEEDNLKKQKQLEIDIINQQKESEKKIKNISFIALGISIALMCGIVFSLVKVNRSKKIIALQQLETEKQKNLVEEKQKEIVDSISYAKRLQEAILPPQEFVNTHLANNFIYYQPKDIVAGDFYWAEKVEDKFFIAAADSTGHGVPGAIVSVVCSNALNRTIKEFKLTETGKILDKTRELVIETFEKSASEVKDGMDISLLCIDSKNKNIYWSGANNPLWYIQDNELKEIKADKQPIGKTEYPKPFTTHEIEYKVNTTFYLFTDGFADQFGGPKGKKFKHKQFSDLLVKNNNLSQSQQAEIINKAFSDWKGDLEQVDDVCVIGIKI